MTLELPKFLADVRVESAGVPDQLDHMTAGGVLWQAESGRFHLVVPGVARYLVEDGGRIRIESAADACPSEVAAFLRMTPLAALLYQRGVLAFHASAVTSGGRTVLIAGPSATGKSALAAALLTRGWRILADDLAPVTLDENGRPIVQPTYPEMVLWGDVIEQKEDLDAKAPVQDGAATAEGIRASAQSTPLQSRMLSRSPHRRVVNVEGEFVREPLSLTDIYWLIHSSEGQDEVEEVQGGRRFEALGKLSYNSRIANALLDQTRYFALATTLSEMVPLRRVRGARFGRTVENLATLVESGGRQ